MFAAVDPVFGTIVGLVITAIVAPTWLSWWNTKQTKKEFKPNGGSSIKDSLNRLEISVAATRQTSLTLASVIGVAYFQADSEGSYVYVSRDWQRLAGMFAEDALGTGWTTSIHPDDKIAIVASWEEAVESGRAWRASCKLASGKHVHMTANPIKSHSGIVEGYVGFFEAEDDGPTVPGFP